MKSFYGWCSNMNKENEERKVAEMAVLGCKRNPQAHTTEECYNCIFKEGGCDSYTHAEILYSLGYRKNKGV